MKKAWKSKTMWMGIATTSLGVLSYLETVPELPRWALIVVGALIVCLRMITTTQIQVKSDEAKKTLKALIIMSICLLFAACGTLTVKAKKSADCQLVQGPPHSIKCKSDGKVVFEQSGPMKLEIKGACPCPN